MSDRTCLRLAKDPGVSATVVSVGESLLHLYDEVIRAITLDRRDAKRRAQQLCLAYYAGKIQRVTRAALTLILAGQGEEALSILREQNEFVIALNYYHKYPDQAVLFMASQVLLKRNFAREIMSFDDSVASDQGRIKQLEELEEEAKRAYRRFPGLQRPKGKSANSPSPVYTDWSEPSSKDMFDDLMRGWLQEGYQARGERIDELEFNERLEKMVAKAYFFRSTFINQVKHGTAFMVVSTVEINDKGGIVLQDHELREPNQLAYHFIQNPMPSLKLLRDFNGIPDAFEAELGALGEAYAAMRTEFGIQDQPVLPVEAPTRDDVERPAPSGEVNP